MSVFLPNPNPSIDTVDRIGIGYLMNVLLLIY